MSRVKIGNGSWLASYLREAKYHDMEKCQCNGNEVEGVLTALAMAGSNLKYFYNGQKCQHGRAIKAEPVADFLDNHYEPAIKVIGTPFMKGWLKDLLKGTMAVIFFKSYGAGMGRLDLYLGNRQYVDIVNENITDELWIWVLPGYKAPKAHHHHHKSHKSHKSQIHIF